MPDGRALVADGVIEIIEFRLRLDSIRSKEERLLSQLAGEQNPITMVICPFPGIII